MKLRCDLNVNGGERKLLIVQGPNEPESHLALKLAACLLFWDSEPLVDASVKLPVLAGFEFLPDLIGLDAAGESVLWVECGSVTMHKLKKVTRRMPRARIVVMKETEREAARLRQDLTEQFDRPERIEILAWPGASFKDWAGRMQERVQVYGEGGGLMLNLVLNEHPVVIEFKAY